MSFLQAEWRKLVLANYAIDSSKLAPYVPYGTELDIWKGTCYASLVGFMFFNTKLLGIKVPRHVNFEEFNLRFYVKRKTQTGWKRGVVFIKEIVPKPALSWVANTIYKEHYETHKMAHHWDEAADYQEVVYRWKTASKWQSIGVQASKTPADIPHGSEEEFITEHYWGYAKVGKTRTNEYEVTHPRWQHYKTQASTITVDFERVYGKEFGFLNQEAPVSVMLAEGSTITVEKKRKLTASSFD